MYLITLILLYWVGFDAPNLLHLILIIMFLVFYAFGSTLQVKEKVKSNGEPTQVITTFTESYWFLIVIFVGLAILLKYVYFLFFSWFQADWLDPIGIAEVYSVPFNFSFKSCKSNTTPLFWILILSTLQLAITKSTIYLRYSYSIMAVLSSKNTFKKHSKIFNEIISFISTIFYKSLFALSAVITLLCDFRWSVNGILIGVLCAYGLLYGFGEGRLWMILMWINIFHIFFNYFGMFLSYPAITQLLGPNVSAQIEKYAYMLGCFEVTSTGLHSLFLESIVIFILSVECSELYHILQETAEIDAQDIQMSVLSDPTMGIDDIVSKAEKIELN